MPTCPNGHATTATDYCDTCGAPLDAAAEPAAPAATEPEAAQSGPVAADAAKPCPNCHGVNPPNALFCEACGYDFTTGSLPRLSTLAPDAAAPAEPQPEAAAEPEPEAAAEPAAAEPVPVPADVFDLDAPAPAAEAVEIDLDAPAPVQAPAAVTPEEPVDAEVIEEAPPAPVAAAAAPAPATPMAPVPPAPEAPAGKAEWVAEVWIDPDWYAGQDSPDQLPSPGLPRIVGLRKRASLIGRPSRSRGITPDIDAEPDTGVSRRHAELTTDGTRWWIEDLGSSNGTYVGRAGAPLPEQPITRRTVLAEDARVYVGSWTRIVVRRADPEEADL